MLWEHGRAQAEVNQKLSAELKLITASREREMCRKRQHVPGSITAQTLRKLKPEVSGSDSHGLQWELTLFRLV